LNKNNLLAPFNFADGAVFSTSGVAGVVVVVVGAVFEGDDPDPVVPASVPAPELVPEVPEVDVDPVPDVEAVVPDVDPVPADVPVLPVPPLVEGGDESPLPVPDWPAHVVLSSVQTSVLVSVLPSSQVVLPHLAKALQLATPGVPK